MSTDEVHGSSEAIAVIGMACRFPKAKNASEFWRNLRDGTESISFFSDQELEESGIDAATIARPDYIRARGVLEDADLFDADFFGFTSREAQANDPQQRVFLECAWEALENAGYNPYDYTGLIGVYAGSSSNTYLSMVILDEQVMKSLSTAQVLIGNDRDFLTTQASYRLNLKGPSVCVQTACSTSLVAVHLACQSLLDFHCDIALGGGVSIRFPRKEGYFYQEGGILSPDGHCRTFDAMGLGTVGGEGVGIVVLKRLSEAIADRDTIHAIIKGSATNNDGADKVGYTAPSVSGQAQVITMAHLVAAIPAETIAYVEAHGTATPMGDPIEVAALTEAFGASTQKKGFCAIGSVKTNLGHLDAAAGVAGLIKAILAVKHKMLPPSLHFSRPNPNLRLEDSPFYVNARLAEWPANGGPRRAGVSSFGIGGTNAHVIIEEAPELAPGSPSRQWHLVTLSANSETALEQASKKLAEHLAQHPEDDLSDIEYTLHIGRKDFAHRQALVCANREEAFDALSKGHPGEILTGTSDTGNPQVMFMFPGQGAQHVNMGLGLYQQEPVFRKHVDACSEILKSYLGFDLLDVIYPGQSQSAECEERLRQTHVAQPALFVIEWSLAQLLMEWGIRPKAMIGHSLGEYVAACLSGVLSLEDSLALIVTRANAMQQLPRGGMIAIPLRQSDVEPLLGSDLSIAAINLPSQCVVSGPEEALSMLEQRLARAQVNTARLSTSHAFHSAMVDPALEAFTNRVREINLAKPAIPYVSNVTGGWITDAEATDPSYWSKHMRSPVRFSEGVAHLLKNPNGVLLEVGPGSVLKSTALRHPDWEKQRIVLSSLPSAKDSHSQQAFLLKTLGHLWLAGVSVNWSAFYSLQQRRRVPLPSYPFERKRFFVAPSAEKTERGMHDQTSMDDHAYLTNSTDAKRREDAMSTQQVSTGPDSARRIRIRSSLKESFGDLFGREESEVGTDVPFIEMGADSLFLLHASHTIQKKFDVKVPFRILLDDYPTIDALADYIDHRLPPDYVLDDSNREETTGAGLKQALQDDPGLNKAAPELASHSPVRNQAPTFSEGIELGSLPSGEAYGENVASLLERQLEVLRQTTLQNHQIIAQQLDLLKDLWLRNGKTELGLSPTKNQPESLDGKQQKREAGKRRDVNRPASLTGPLTEQTKSIDPQERGAEERSTDNKLGADIEAEPFVAYEPIERLPGATLDHDQSNHLNRLIQRVTSRTRGSKQLAQNFRPFLADSRGTAGFRALWKEMIYPLVVERGEGSRIWDVDGNEYVDFAMGFGALLFGHSPSFLIEALNTQLNKGLLLGGESPLAGETARLICELTGMDRVAFCNSGTEAIMSALRFARTVTGRDRIAVFEGSYHGTFDEVLVKQAKGQKDREWLAAPLAPGVAEHLVRNVMVLDYDSPRSLEILSEHGDDLAAVIVEPPRSRRPDVQPKEFLLALRKLTEEAGIALIFDEVVTGFRFHPGGAQAIFGIRADLVTYGKAIGGGLPLGVIAGKSRFMDVIDGGRWNYGDDSYPEIETTYFAGTYFKHPLIIPSVWATLNHLMESGPGLQDELEQRTANLARSLNAFFEHDQVPIRVVQGGSIFRFVLRSDLKYKDLFYYYLLYKGIYICETRNCFLSTAHTEQDLDVLLEAVRETVREMREARFLPRPPVSTPPEERATTDAAGVTHNSNGAQIVSGVAGAASASLPLGIARSGDAAHLDRFPLTDGQKQIWIACQLGADANASYNLSIKQELRGLLHVGAMHEALECVVNRHEALRTTFSLDGEYQLISTSAKIELPYADFTSADITARDALIKDWLSEAAMTPFDLANGLLVRACLAKVGNQHHILNVTIHHIVSDGRSIGVFLEEVKNLYSARVQNVNHELPAAVQFREFASWQTALLQGPYLKEAGDYWAGRFSDWSAGVELPSDRPRPRVQTYTGGRYRSVITEFSFDDLQQFSNRAGSTVFMTLLAGFSLLNHRLSGRDDITIAIASAGQVDMGAPGLIGFCVNLLPLRSSLFEHQTFLEFLRSVKNDLLDASQYQNYSFESLISNLNIRREPGKPPLTTIFFNLDVEPLDDRFHGLECETESNFTGSAHFDISLNLTKGKSDLKLECDYNADLFEASTIQRWMKHYETLVKNILAQPEQRVFDLPLLAVEEARQIVVGFNETSREFPEDSLIHQQVEAQAKRRPFKIAVSGDETTLTYSELNRRANKLARHLRGLGVGPEAPVAVCLERSADMTITLLAVLKAGGAYVPIDPKFPPARASFIIEDTGAKLLITQTRLSSSIPVGVCQVFCIDRDSHLLESEAEDDLTATTVPDNLAYIVYTSGSTGKPKGVLTTHRGVINYFDYLAKTYGLASEDIVLQVATFTFDASVRDMIGPLTFGAEVVLLNNDEIANPLLMISKINRHKVSCLLSVVPSMLRALIDAAVEGQPAESLRLILSSGEPLQLSECARLHDQFSNSALIVNQYGPTECTMTSSYFAVTDFEFHTKIALIGKPIQNTRFYIIDSQSEPCPVGIPGEIHIAGVGLSRGYLNRPDLTAEKFLPNLLDENTGSRMYRTGDGARYLPDGSVEFLGRLDHQVKLRGYRIELEEVETILADHPKVRQACVLAREDKPDEKRLTAYIVASINAPPGINELRDYLASQLPDYMIPGHFIYLEAMPLTSNGKLDRKALPAPESSRPDADGYTAPRNQIEQTLADIWGEVLGIECVGVADNFFALGGDSILAIQVAAKGIKAGLKLSPNQLFNNQTIAELIAAIDSPQLSKQDAADSGLPMTPIQEWFFSRQFEDVHHWNQSALFEVPSDISFAILEEAFERVVARHDALRLRFTQSNGKWHMSCAENETLVRCSQLDVSMLPPDEQTAGVEREAFHLHTSLNVSTGPLLGAVHFYFGKERPGCLLIVAHHLAIDAMSWGIVLSDLEAAYQRIFAGEREMAPARQGASFTEWAARLSQHANSPELMAELDYWVEQCRGASGSLPVDFKRGDNTHASSRSVSSSLDARQTQSVMTALPKAYRTAVGTIVLSTIARALSEWTGSRRQIIDIEGHGREDLFEDLDVSNTVGWFTALFPAMLDLGPIEDPVEEVKSIKRHMHSLPKGGIGYGILKYLHRDESVDSQLHTSSKPEVAFNYLGQSGIGFTPSSLFTLLPESPGPELSSKTSRPYLLDISARIDNGRLEMNWTYSENYHRKETIQAVAQRQIDLLTQLVSQSQLAGARAYTASDFAGARLSQAELEKFISAIGHSDEE